MQVICPHYKECEFKDCGHAKEHSQHDMCRIDFSYPCPTCKPIEEVLEG